MCERCLADRAFDVCMKNRQHSLCRATLIANHEVTPSGSVHIGTTTAFDILPGRSQGL